MMGDRPVVAFPWDVVPSRFWGRGVCEKGYNSQKALDAELRARIDALALTIHPMMAIDATRMPRGAKAEVRAGKTILTNGNPAEVLQPLNFGNVSQVTFGQAAELQKMVQTATGAIDSAGISGSINGQSTASGISMSLGAIIKRHKRTLINFQESFLIPFVTKAAHRYMQFNPERYPVADYKFHTSSSLGIIAREYEVTQLVQLLQTMQQDNPMYSQLIMSIIDNMNLSNREELISSLQQANQPNPEAQQAQQAMHSKHRWSSRSHRLRHYKVKRLSHRLERRNLRQRLVLYHRSLRLTVSRLLQLTLSQAMQTTKSSRSVLKYQSSY